MSSPASLCPAVSYGSFVFRFILSDPLPCMKTYYKIHFFFKCKPKTQGDVEKFLEADPQTPCVIGFYNEDIDKEVTLTFPLLLR